MFAVELQFESTVRGAADAKVEAIQCLIAAFVRNGSLLDESLVAVKSEVWMVHGIAPARDAFQKAHWNEFVHQRIANLASANLKRPRPRFLGLIPETASDCQCIERSGLFLFTTFLEIAPPVRCMDCNGIVPTYRLPRATTGEHSKLILWESNYQACDTLQMNCNVGERFGERQMSNPASDLSRSGISICKEIERLTGRPVYYYLYRPKARSRSAEMGRKCPNCGGRWLLTQPLHNLFDFKCDQCKLLSNVAWNVR